MIYKEELMAWFAGNGVWHEYIMVFLPVIFKATDSSSFTHLLSCVTFYMSLSVTWAFNLSGKKYDKAEGTKKRDKMHEQKQSNQSFNDECFLPLSPLKISIARCLTVIVHLTGIRFFPMVFSVNCPHPLSVLE